MAATANVAQLSPARKSSSNSVESLWPRTVAPRSGVITLTGYGIRVEVERNHLLLRDGLASDCQQFRLSRVGHGLERLIVIGNDGSVSLSALRWLADQNAAFVMLERDGSVLCVTGPVRPSDARLRRAQALAHRSDVALTISKDLMSRKILGQQNAVRDKLRNDNVAEEISRFHSDLASVQTLDGVRIIESRAAASYWAAWRDLPIIFPKSDHSRTPEHWQKFDTRKSVLSGSPRLATNPANAILNYLYAVLESESRLALAALGLDPGMGFVHMDAPARDSLACDLMEAVRPQVDSYVLDWLLQHPLKREWFFEQRDGNCRLMGRLAIRLSETAPMWRRAVAPIAEWIARSLWTRSRSQSSPPTRLTQRRKREATGAVPLSVPKSETKPEALCQGCGKNVRQGSTHCIRCVRETNTRRMIKAARTGRAVSHAPEAEEKRAATQRINTQAAWDWKASDQPAWLTASFYCEKIQPILKLMSSSVIAKSIGVSRCYASTIRKGRVPHPRHWAALSELLKLR